MTKAQTLAAAKITPVGHYFTRKGLDGVLRVEVGVACIRHSWRVVGESFLNAPVVWNGQTRAAGSSNGRDGLTFTKHFTKRAATDEAITFLKSKVCT